MAIHFTSYTPGQPRPFVFETDRGQVALARDTAVTMALHIIGAAAVMEKLSLEERERLRMLADSEPA
jgi:hypothetical protein